MTRWIVNVEKTAVNTPDISSLEWIPAETSFRILRTVICGRIDGRAPSERKKSGREWMKNERDEREMGSSSIVFWSLNMPQKTCSIWHQSYFRNCFFSMYILFSVLFILLFADVLVLNPFTQETFDNVSGFSMDQ